MPLTKGPDIPIAIGIGENFLDSSIKLFRYYKSLGESAIEQLTDELVLPKPNAASNGLALIVRHGSGNIFQLSRMTSSAVLPSVRNLINSKRLFGRIQ